MARDVAVQMCDLFEGRDFTGVMNVSYVAASTQPHAKPFMQLAEMMGAVLAQLSGSEISSLQLKTWGGRDFNITTKQVRVFTKCNSYVLCKHVRNNKISIRLVIFLRQ